MRVLMICPELPSANRPGTMAPGARQIQSIQQAGIDTEVVDMRGIPKLKYLQMIPRIRAAIGRADLIHAHFGYCGWLALIGRKLALRRVPIVMSFMGSDLLGSPLNANGDLRLLSQLEIKFNKSLAGRFDQIIVKSKEMAGKIPKVETHVVPNGVDLTVFKPSDQLAACREVGLESAQINVLFPGNPNDPRKGYPLAQASVKIAEQLLGASINIVPLYKISPALVPVFMNACNAMLMTSVFEGSPNVVKEAMACNLPVIGVPVGDVHELLEGVEGCYRTSRQPDEIGRALSQLLTRAQSSNGREVIQARELSLPSVAQRIIAIYKLALGSSSSASEAQRLTA